MMGTKRYQEKMFYNFSLSRRVPEDHFLRKVAKVVNLSFVRKLVRPYYSHTGQPFSRHRIRAIDPLVLFKMMLIGYFYGITSERRLAEEVSLNMAFMWYLGYDLDESTPNHSVISKARARYGKEVFEQFFQRVLSFCVEAGLAGGEHVFCVLRKVFVDFTLIKANASLKSIVPRQDLAEPKFSPKEYVERVFAENPVEADPSCDSKERDELKKGGRGKVNKELISTTDPDASIYKRPGIPYQLAYKEHVAVDSKARVITSVKVTSAGVADHQILPDLIEGQPLRPKEVCADKVYGVVDSYAHLFDKGILPSIPRHSTAGWRYTGRFPQDNFTYDKKRDVYLCPGKKFLKRKKYDKRWHRWEYRVEKGICKGCKLRAQCTTSKAGRTVIRYDRQEALDFALAHLKTGRAKVTIKQRQVYAETIFAEAKNSHGLRKAICRGLEKVAIQALLICAVQNIKRLIKHYSVSVTNLLYVLRKFHHRERIWAVTVTQVTIL